MCINKRYTEFTKFLYGVYPYNNNHHLCKLKSLKISVDTFKSIQGKCYLLRSHQLYCLHQKKGHMNQHLSSNRSIPLKPRVFRLYVNRLHIPQESVACALKEVFPMKKYHHLTKYTNFPFQEREMLKFSQRKK